MTNMSNNYLRVLENEGTDSKIYFSNIKKAHLILRALNNELRQRMLKMLEEQEKLTVTEIYGQLNLQQSVASQHLAILRRANMVMTYREGKLIYYLLNHRRIAEIAKCVVEVLSHT